MKKFKENKIKKLSKLMAGANKLKTKRTLRSGGFFDGTLGNESISADLKMRT